MKDSSIKDSGVKDSKSCVDSKVSKDFIAPKGYKDSKNYLDSMESSKDSKKLDSINVEILVLDFGSQVTQLIARRLREEGVYTEIVPYFENIDSIRAKNAKGIILSGGPASVYEKDSFKPDSAIFTLGVPVLGICYGMQYIAYHFGGKVARATKQEFGKAKLYILETSKDDILFKGVGQDSIVWMSHADKVETLPQGFVELASSRNTHYCVIADIKRKIYAMQFHPEVAHTQFGGVMLRNFAVNICGCDTSWNMKNFAKFEIEKLRHVIASDSEAIHTHVSDSESKSSLRDKAEAIHKNSKKSQNLDSKKTIIDLQVWANAAHVRHDLNSNEFKSRNDKDSKALSPHRPTNKVLCAVSGGVDSSVVATLLYRAIGDNLIPVFVDTGLLRAGERKAVEKMFKENLKVPLITIDAESVFLGKLKGVIEPESKRKIIGETFIEIFEKEAKKHNKNGEIKYLAQGTLYPDVIESVSVKGPSKTIKSHHNVGGLPEWMKFELIEPLRELFKDEARALGRELSMPESMLMRHPFPGPGLAIRILGEVNKESLALLRKADSIFIESLHEFGLYNSVWQAFCVLLNVKSVGVMGDNRTYDNTIALRSVNASDGMTATFSHLPFEFLESVSNRIINEVSGINRVVYDITSKPPGTIEWE